MKSYELWAAKMEVVSCYFKKTNLRVVSYFLWVAVLKETKHCVKRVSIRSYSSPHFSRIFPHSDWIRNDTDYLSIFSPNAGKSGKIRTRITSNTNTFYAVMWFILYHLITFNNTILQNVKKTHERVLF